ncbi:MAG: hypothetical protein QW594_03120, partial [Candidatus Woesearchaeota archaeon]
METRENQNNQTFVEGKASVAIQIPTTISKKMPVFYNPSMALNRTLSILVLEALEKTQMKAALALEGSGIRAVRMLLELPEEKIKELYINDISQRAIEKIHEHLILNGIKNKARVSRKDASVFLLEHKPFSYIDLDPFGSPNPYLDAACKAITHQGVLSITATDTAALTGTYPKTCLRKYWAQPLRNAAMHEIGLRILIRKVQLIGVQYEKALLPILSYSKDHYYRIFFEARHGKQACDALVQDHGFYISCKNCLWHKGKRNKEGEDKSTKTTKNLLGDYKTCPHCKYKPLDLAGPLYVGNLFREPVIKTIRELANTGMQKQHLSQADKKFLATLEQEATYEMICKKEGKQSIGMYDLH